MKPYIRLTFFLLLCVFQLLYTGCSKPSADEIPAYIAIDTASVKPTSLQGTASQKVFDTWVYADNELIGAFELPARFPILKTGASQLTVFAGIKMNGINETRVPYPFYQKIQRNVTLEPEKITELGHLKFTYVDGTKFAWLEDFEHANHTLDSTARSQIDLVRTKMPELAAAFPNEGNEYAAKIIIPSDTLIFECTSHDAFKLPTDGSSVFLELNYKSNNAFTVGLMVNGILALQHAVLGINPSSTWNKIYINLTPTLSANTDASSFKVFFWAKKTTKDAQAEICIDNIKLLHF
jgi:hypothetical protein